MKQQTCNAVGCRALILPTDIFCQRHEDMLQSDIRAILHRQYRPGRKQTELFDINLAVARDEILYAQMEGHRAPRATEFEW